MESELKQHEIDLTKYPLPINKVEYGIANNFGTHIEINKNLIAYPKLLKPILEHEFAHTNKKVSMEDFKLDFIMPQAIHQKELVKFMLKHPKSFTQLLPIYYSKEKGIVYDFNLIVMYLIMAGVFIATIYLGGKLIL